MKPNNTGRDNKKRDVFAGIAAERLEASRQSLAAMSPPELPVKYLPAGKSDPKAVFSPAEKLDTQAKLRRELARQRKRYKKFLEDLAPAIRTTRVRSFIRSFDWREQTAADLADFAHAREGRGKWRKVDIPHYGPPLGRAVAYYRAAFTVTHAMLARGAVFICFKGVDYKAHVFVNGSLVGSHEGFFALFEFDATAVVHAGRNILLVKVENDAICMGNDSWGEDGKEYEGDKLYAATGPGYDDPLVGWHHCPPGMGIYQDVWVEARLPVHIADIFVRPVLEESRAEAWIEIGNCLKTRREIGIELSLFGQNFRKTLFKDRSFAVPGPMGPTANYLRLPLDIPKPLTWDLETPWLYQLQVKVTDKKTGATDIAARQFGMRSFRIDEKSATRGRLFLNGAEIRLRGANTMGFEQRCVMQKDFRQLVDDILLAKICNMNFWRLTQRPVQPEVYDYCDRLGLMTQTDLPLFGVLRRNQFCEAVRQAGEMERLVRAHPCNIMDTYINEPFPAAWDKAHRHLLRPELERFFQAADQAVLLENPDRVIKPVDGDYDPPAPGLPDNHCYCGWYNGHGVDLGKLHKGHWQRVKPGWFYACGEFGTEGLDPVNVMRKYYPPAWLPLNAAEEKRWTPDRIITDGCKGTQTGRFHYMWFESKQKIADWVQASQSHQAWVTRIMTEAFRRDSRMVSCAIHLFIDAFPDGWMKAIMDVDRQPKPAFFAYREALAPLMAHWRSDRRACFAGEEIKLEAWVCNDRPSAPGHCFLNYQVEQNGRPIFAQRIPAKLPSSSAKFQGFLRYRAPQVRERTELAFRIGLVEASGRVLHDSALAVSVFPRPAAITAREQHYPPHSGAGLDGEETTDRPDGAQSATGGRLATRRAWPAPEAADRLTMETGCPHPDCFKEVYILGARDGIASKLADELGLKKSFLLPESPGGVLLIDDYRLFFKHRRAVVGAVRGGASAIFLELPVGKYEIGGGTVEVRACGMNPVHFVARNTGHRLVDGFEPDDFKFWHDPKAGYVKPILATTFRAVGWDPILTSGNGDWRGNWSKALAAAEKRDGQGAWRVCQVDLSGRTAANPVARLFAMRLLTPYPFGTAKKRVLTTDSPAQHSRNQLYQERKRRFNHGLH